MKNAKRIGWVLALAGFAFAGRERLAADRLQARADQPASGPAARPDKKADVGGFFDAHTSTEPASGFDWMDYALGTFPDAPVYGAKGARGGAGKPSAPGVPGAQAPQQPFHWLDTHSNPSVVKEGVGGKARAKRGAGVLIDSHHRRWEIEPKRSSATAPGAPGAPAAAADDAPDDEPTAAPIDPAEIARRRDNSMTALKCAGAAAAALLIW